MKFIILSIITAEPEIIVLVLIHLLYNAFIKSHVKFSSSVWNSESATVKNKLESVQYKFLKYMFIRSITPENDQFHNIPSEFKLIKLFDSRNIIDVSYINL